MKKIITISLAAIMLISTLTSCISSTTTPSSQNATSSSSQTTTSSETSQSQSVADKEEYTPIVDDNKVITEDGKTLTLQVDQEEITLYHLLQDDFGYALIYVKEMKDENGNIDKPVMVDFFSKSGNHTTTADVMLSAINGKRDLENLTLYNNLLTFQLNGVNFFEVDRTTGIATCWVDNVIFVENGYTLKMREETFTGKDILNATVFRLIDPHGEVYSITLSTTWDQNLLRGIPHDSPHPIHNTGENTSMTFHPETKIVTLSTEKIAYTLDFVNGIYTDERSYPHHIMNETPLAVSPSGKIQLLYADNSGIGDAFWFDLIIKDELGMRFIEECSGLNNFVFIDDDYYITSNISSAKIVNTKTLDHQPVSGLTFKQVPQYDDFTSEKWILGLTVDRQNSYILAAVRDYGFEDETESVSILVMDDSGTLLWEIPTNITIATHYKNYPVTYALEVNDDILTLSTYYTEEFISLTYPSSN